MGLDLPALGPVVGGVLVIDVTEEKARAVRWTMIRMSELTRTDQKLLSLARSSLWKLSPGRVGSTWRSKAVVFTAFCSSPVRRARESVKESAMRKVMGAGGRVSAGVDPQVLRASTDAVPGSRS
jgi:hypothetical protein